MIKPKKGFTLIEIMVVMVIIGILAGLSLAASMGAKKSARDGKRKADLEQIRSALEMYKTDNNNYVSEVACDSSIGVGVGSTCPINPPGSDWGGDIASELETKYIGDLPKDPINNSTYYYYYEPVCNETTTNVCGVSRTCTGVGNCCAYELGAYLETTSQWYRVCNP